MSGRDDDGGRKQERMARKLERRLVRLDRKLGGIRRDLIDAVDEAALLEGRLAALRGYRPEGEVGGLVEVDAAWEAGEDEEKESEEDEEDDEAHSESDGGPPGEDDDSGGDESSAASFGPESGAAPESAAALESAAPAAVTGEPAATLEPTPRPAAEQQPAPQQPASQPPSVGPETQPTFPPETPWQRGVRELAERRAAGAEVDPEPKTEPEAEPIAVPNLTASVSPPDAEAPVDPAASMDRLLAGSPAPPAADAWPVIDPDRTW